MNFYSIRFWNHFYSRCSQFSDGPVMHPLCNNTVCFDFYKIQYPVYTWSFFDGPTQQEYICLTDLNCQLAVERQCKFCGKTSSHTLNNIKLLSCNFFFKKLCSIQPRDTHSHKTYLPVNPKLRSHMSSSSI